jgi:glycosyltransferase involved in cell wall biosynthesis
MPNPLTRSAGNLSMDASGRIPVTHIITGLETGGAETMLLRLLQFTKLEKFPSRVISITGNGPVGRQIEAMGIPVFTLGMNPARPSIADFSRLVRELKSNPPAVIQTWMYHADLIGGLAGCFVPHARTVWGIHNSTLDKATSKRSTRIIVGINALLSRFIPAKIIACSRVAQKIHVERGYRADCMVFIPNGFDLEDFKPDADARAKLRAELGIPPNAYVAGLAARFDPQKDHATFFAAANEIMQHVQNLHLILCGDGITPDNPELAAMVAGFNKPDNIHLLGRRDDMKSVYPAWDIAVLSSSYGEAFPLVIGEAMACGIPCVGTDVGDTAELIGDTGRTVPPRKPGQLAGAAVKILSLPEGERRELGRKARERIMENFEIRKIADLYSQVWRQVTGTR